MSPPLLLFHLNFPVLSLSPPLPSSLSATGGELGARDGWMVVGRAAVGAVTAAGRRGGIGGEGRQRRARHPRQLLTTGSGGWAGASGSGDGGDGGERW